MAKQKQLEGMEETFPEPVLKAAEEYDAAHAAKARATKKFNNARTKLLEVMEDHGVERVPVRNGEKFLQHEIADKVNYKKPEDVKPKLKGRGADGFTGGSGGESGGIPLDVLGLTDAQRAPLEELGIKTVESLGQLIDGKPGKWQETVKGFKTRDAGRVENKLSAYRESLAKDLD